MSRTLLHVFATFGAGGPQTRAVQILGRCPAEWRHVIVAMDGRTEAAALLDDGLPVAWRPPPATSSVLASVRALAAVVDEVGPDLVLTSNWGAIEAVWAAQRRRVPVVHHEDGFGPGEVRRRFRRRNWLRRRLLRRAAAVIVPSRGLRDIAVGEWRVAGERVRHLVNGVDLRRFHPGEERADRPFTVGTVGGLRPEKDHELLLEAVARLGGAARLVVVGDGERRGRLEDRARALGIADRATFRGAVGDPAGEYRTFDAYALSSRTEQMPIGVLEAMASGLPVAATDVGDVRAVLGEAGEGMVVPAGDAPALAGALATLRDDRDAARRRGRTLRARCEQEYDAARCLPRYIEVYRRALERAPAG